jgi:hypothetical protein
VALPVFKIGCFPLVGEAGFDSQALPPTPLSEILRIFTEQSDVAFLAIDRNNDGYITDGSELFGNHTHPEASNGFEALHKLALESNGGQERYSVSADDPLFSKLLLWTDSNHNGLSEPDELQAAADVVSDIGLGYQLRKRTDKNGNIFAYRGWVHLRTKPGRDEADTPHANKERTRAAWDVYLKLAQ